MCCRGRHFLHPSEGPSDPPKSFPSDATTVTALYFAPRLASLFVGLSFGSFQIYCLSGLTLVYASPSPSPQLLPPVTHFTYMEPENDPKSFVYVWVGRGATPFADV